MEGENKGMTNNEQAAGEITGVGERFSRETILKGDFSLEQCRTAAEEGDASAQGLMGDCYQYGWYVKKDYAAAVEWYEKASVQGNASAQRSLGWC